MNSLTPRVTCLHLTVLGLDERVITPGLCGTLVWCVLGQHSLMVVLSFSRFVSSWAEEAWDLRNPGVHLSSWSFPEFWFPQTKAFLMGRSHRKSCLALTFQSDMSQGQTWQVAVT